MGKTYDFAGWVTKNDVKCQDGITIKHDAFATDDGLTVPLVWNHDHDNPENVLGSIRLENHDEGVYGYGTFNNSKSGEEAKELVRHGDINAMSIFARKLKCVGQDLLHGAIKEVSLVLSGANPGALIDVVNIAHGDNGVESMSEAIIYTGNIIHSADTEPPVKEETQVSEERTVQDVLDTLNDEQEEAVGALLQAIMAEDNGEDDYDDYDEEDESVKHNAFDRTDNNDDYIQHDEIAAIVGDARTSGGKLSDQFLAHGITGIDILFPEATSVDKTPNVFGHVNTATEAILAGVSKSPFSRVKNLIANVTGDDARALGYITGDRKMPTVFSLLGRETHPQTIYVKQHFERDDIIDVTDLDVVSFGQSIMRTKLNEEIARAILIGDGRAVEDPNKIKEDRIRPIISDDDLYTIKMTIPSVGEVLEGIILALGEYRGSGTPALYIQPNLLAKMKLVKANDGRYLFGDIQTNAAIAARLGVSKIVETTFFKEPMGVIVNLSDYTLGASKGGQISSYENFDIDFNLQKFLMETRLSGALTEPYSAIFFKVDTTATTIGMSQTGGLPEGKDAWFDAAKGSTSSSITRRKGLSSTFVREDPRYGGAPSKDLVEPKTFDEGTTDSSSTPPAGE